MNGIAADHAQVEIVTIDHNNLQVFHRLVQCYEAEFSPITGKVPGSDGLFPLDTEIDELHAGYLLYHDGVPAGFSIVAVKPGCCYEVSEFYVVPVFRSRRLGYLLAADCFQRYKGGWEVKQIAGADKAIEFWRKTIDRYTGGQYKEDINHDAYWGTVTRQRFSTA